MRNVPIIQKAWALDEYLNEINKKRNIGFEFFSIVF